ncbi:methyltransferase [Candidatus Halobonum tyrrellensis]|uniref:Type 12 methyltransferase n=1 Tax=Candidatus Halobonum tyrrellensis G22 TaxID=1324957 RepID=V4GSJ6_9EURY|nr:methyltransferase [Candidatus Halobonum tyrrellensis]ESP88066.1 type 12 methyltransferase [Candidatus Halobonum tyrrellensis G22]
MSGPGSSDGATDGTDGRDERDPDTAGTSLAAVLLVHPDSSREYVRAPGEELQTDLGVLTVPADVESGDLLETHLGEPFRARRLRGPDLFNHFERTGAPMMPRDIGLVVGHVGAQSGDRVLDAGTGTGVLAGYLGRLGARVTTYEQDADFAAVARGNMELAGVADRVDVRTGDVRDDLDALAGSDADADTESDPDSGSGFDLLTLDTADAAAVVERAPDLLVSGGYCAVYAPFVEDARAAEEAARAAGLAGVETLETIQRELNVDERGTRPSTAGVGHTGYLTFGRVE